MFEKEICREETEGIGCDWLVGESLAVLRFQGGVLDGGQWG